MEFEWLKNKVNRGLQVLGSRAPYYRNENKVEKLFNKYGALCLQENGVTLDIGSGPSPRNPFAAKEVFGADFRSNEDENVVFTDLSMARLPFSDEQFDFITAYDVLEHIERVRYVDGSTEFPLILLMNEIFRILKPGGVFYNIQPCYPAKEAFQDPTHVNIMTEDTIRLYFCESAWARIYGYTGSFEMLDHGWVGYKYFSFLRKLAVEPVRDLNFIQK